MIYLKTFLKASKYSLIIYVAIWIAACFIMWDFRGPFQPIIDIPKYDETSRFVILFFYFSYHLTFQVIAHLEREEQIKPSRKA